MKRDTKLRVASHVGKYDEASVVGLLDKVTQRMTKRAWSLFVADGARPIPPAMLTVFGQPRVEGGHRGPRWTVPRRDPPAAVAFARVIKQRDPQGRLVHIQEEITWGDPNEVWAHLDPERQGRHISTFCIERDNLTLRLHTSRLTRQTLRFSKQRPMLETVVELEDAYYNFCLPHERLKGRFEAPQPTKGNGSPKKWEPRTPMMAEGLTDHVWSVEELLTFRVPPRHLWSKFSFT